MRGDNVPSVILHFGVVISESAEEAEIYIWKQCLRTLFPNDSSDLSIVFPFPLKCQNIFIRTMVHSYLVYNCGAGTASTFCIAGANILSFWVYKMAKPAWLSQIITKIYCGVKFSLENSEFGGQTLLTKHNEVCLGNANIKHVRCMASFV